MGLGQCVSPDIYWAGQCGEWLVVGVEGRTWHLAMLWRAAVGWQAWGWGSCGGWGGTLKCFWLAAAVGSGGRQTCNLAVQLNQHYLHVSDR